jgi:hypothetical protein
MAIRLIIKSCFIFLLFVLLLSCRKKDEIYTYNPNAKLEFNGDTLLFDTIFSGISTTTQQLQVFNNNDQAIYITSVSLGGGSASPFIVTINGVTTNQLDHVPLRGHDSLYILVRGVFPAQNNSLPYIVEDSLEFFVNGNRQLVRLVAYVQDVHLIDGGTACNVTWANDKPYLLYNNFTVPAGCVLTVDPGVKIYSHDNSGIIVQGTLLVNGTSVSPVLITHDKIDYRNKNLSGQWGGITFKTGSKNNRIRYTSILSGNNGVLMEAENDADTIAELTMDHVTIQNCTHAGFSATSTDALVYNLLTVNCGDEQLYVNGGNVHIWHATFADYSYDLVRLNKAVVLRNDSDLKFRLHNSIVYGDRTESLSLPSNMSNLSDLRIDSSIVRSALTYTGSNNLNVDPKYVAYYKRDFHLLSTSPALNIAALSFVIDDLEGKIRGATPDRGAYEF